MKYNRIIITGASDGLGQEFAKLCIAENIEIVCLSRRQPSYPCVHIKTDLSDDKSIIASVEIIKEKYSEFGALIHCAGVFSTGNPEEVDYAEMEHSLKVNVMAPIFLTSQLLNLIRKNEADILTLGSTIGTKGSNGKQWVYSVSKWAVQGIHATLKEYMKDTDCRVILFNPGGMQTEFFDKFKEGITDTKTFMNPVDIAKLMLYTLKLPKNVEVSEILINRKASK